jgi:hypothetical protein
MVIANAAMLETRDTLPPKSRSPRGAILSTPYVGSRIGSVVDWTQQRESYALRTEKQQVPVLRDESSPTRSKQRTPRLNFVAGEPL